MNVVKENPLKTRQDLEQALLDLVQPVYRLMATQEKQGRVHLGDSGTVYDQPRQEIEGFLRTLWGLGPLFHHPEKITAYPTLFDQAKSGILAGTNPDSPFYWGELQDYDQLFVEMGALATFLILTKESCYDSFTKTEQKQLCQWLNQINQHTIPPTNWLFFRILVNSFFEIVNYPFPTEQLENDLAEIQRYYLADGWYFDGYENQIDYYIPFGMQYYGLLYAQLTSHKESPYAKVFCQRAAAFATTFKDWFSKNGAALPFGRSLTYRFAQSAFFAAAAFAKQDFTGLSQAEGKYLLLNNMRQWFQQPIFTTDGLLSIGYAYPNLVMAEGYNAPGSPYWAFKNFILLALPEDDAFWQLPETCPDFPKQVVNPYSRMLLVHSDDGQELQAFISGQHSHEHAHGQAKYEKYVYSTTFGFSVPKGSVLPKQGAFDSTLALSEQEINYQTAFGFKEYRIHDDYIYNLWQPWEDVTIKTFVIPCYPWHIRIHQIETQRSLHLLAGSFSAPKDGHVTNGKQLSYAETSVGTTGIKLFTPGSCEVTQPEPNTNLLHPQTHLPQGHFEVAPGKETIVLACLGHAGKTFSDAPTIDVAFKGKKVSYWLAGKEHTVTLAEAME